MRSHRTIVNLISAEPSSNPWPKRRRYRGTKKLGISYEKLVAKETKGVHNQWFRFIDANGQGYCCPDVLLDLPEGLFVLECKLSDRDEAKTQLTDLYLPVVSLVYGKTAHGIVVTKHVTAYSTNICESLSSAMSKAEGSVPTLHWLGRGPL